MASKHADKPTIAGHGRTRPTRPATSLGHQNPFAALQDEAEEEVSSAPATMSGRPDLPCCRIQLLVHGQLGCQQRRSAAML